MAHEIRWHLEGRIVFIRLEGILTPDDADQFDQDIMPYLDNAQAPLIHFVFDNSKLERLPDLASLTRFTWTRAKKVGKIIGFPRTSPIIFVLASTAARLSGMRVNEANSLDEALAFLQSADPTLPNLKTEAGR